jgi:hypothetical protein
MTRVKNEIKSLDNKLNEIIALLNQKSIAENVKETAENQSNEKQQNENQSNN